MSYEMITYEVRNNIGYITINRPKALNALNGKAIEELGLAAHSAADDPGVKGLIITGAGEKAFVAGADIDELSKNTGLTGMDFSLRGQAVFNFIEQMTKPVIAAINGFALGGGCELAMSCHMRVAAANARFGQPEVKLGVIPGYGGTQRLPRLIGEGRALELILTGEMIDAGEAHRIGLVNKVVPGDQLVSACEAILTQIFQRGPVAIKLGIEAVRQGRNMALGEALRNEAYLFGLSCGSEDMKEGARAFIEKRPANFQGR